MSQSNKDSSRPLVRLEMEGDIKYPVCRTCAMLYMGELSTAKEIKDNVSRMVEDAQIKGENVVILKLPEIEYRPLRPAITIGQSVYDRETTTLVPDGAGNPIPTTIFLDPPGPVCWVHLQGFKPQRDEEISKDEMAGNGVSSPRTSPLITGKSHQNVRSL